MRMLTVAIATVLLASLAPAAAQAASCQYVMGFATMAAAVPQVGQCQDNQAYAPNGDAQQHTTGGLLVWRKADNWTAFTDGYQTWLNGPTGIQQRLNTEHFSWEAPPASAPVPAAAPIQYPQPAAQPQMCHLPPGMMPAGVVVPDKTAFGGFRINPDGAPLSAWFYPCPPGITPAAAAAAAAAYDTQQVNAGRAPTSINCTTTDANRSTSFTTCF